MLSLTVLGSCGTFPAPDRACSGYLVQIEANGNAPTSLLIDVGSGSLANLQKFSSIHDLDAVWLSHLHLDHCSDLILAYYLAKFSAKQRDRPLPVYGPPGWHDHLCRASVSERDLSDFFEIHELQNGTQLDLGPAKLTAIRTLHSVETYGLRLTHNSITIGYSADTASCDAVGEIANQASLFLCEAAVPDHKREYPPNHLTPGEAANWAQRASASHLALTHIRPDADTTATLQQAMQDFHRPISIAREGDVFEF